MKICHAMVAGAVTLSFAGVAAAQDLPVPGGGGFERIVGAAIVVLPDYEGSDDYTFPLASSVKAAIEPFAGKAVFADG